MPPASRTAQGSYANRFKAALTSTDEAPVRFALLEMEALTKLDEGAFKKQYAREVNTTFTGEKARAFAEENLSTASQRKHNSPSFMDRLFGRKLASQHNPKTASRD